MVAPNTPASGGGKGGPGKSGGGKSSGGVKGGGGAAKVSASLKNPLAGENVAPANSVPAHMAKRVERGQVGLKGKWSRWPAFEEFKGG